MMKIKQNTDIYCVLNIIVITNDTLNQKHVLSAEPEWKYGYSQKLLELQMMEQKLLLQQVNVVANAITRVDATVVTIACESRDVVER